MRAQQAGGLGALRANADQLRAAVEFATACGAFTTTRPGAIGAQPSEQQVHSQPMRSSPHALATALCCSGSTGCVLTVCASWSRLGSSWQPHPLLPPLHDVFGNVLQHFILHLALAPAQH